MPKTIQQSVTLPAAPSALFEMYLDPAQHAAFTGAPVTIGCVPGAEFRAFNGMLSGTILHIVPRRRIVQLWRSAHFGPEDLDSILILTFSPAGNCGRIDLLHIDVADQDYDGVNQGWEKYYWVPWRRYLEQR